MGKVNIRYLAEVNWQIVPPASMTLNAGDVHVYRIGISSNLQHLQAFSATLNPAEKERGQKYHQLKDIQRFVVSRGALRNILARYLAQTAAEIIFAIGDNKKPYLLNPGGISIQYNITHAGDYILLALSNNAVGADVEYIDENFLFDDILDEHFNKDEVSFINQNNKAQRFYLLWTRKEALLKATSQGLGEHLQITPSLDGGHQLPFGLQENDKDWELSSFSLPNNHIGSIAGLQQSGQWHFYDVAF